MTDRRIDSKIASTYEEVGRLWGTLDSERYRKMPATRGLFAIVDERNFKLASLHRWYAVIASGDHVYAVTDIKGKRISLQRFILAQSEKALGKSDVKHVSFINKVTLDCREENLASSFGRQAVMRNRRPKRGTSSNFKGVVKATRTDGTIFFRTQIKGDLGSFSLGNYSCEEAAARAYDAAASILFGENAYQNFPDQSHSLEDMENAAYRIKRFSERKRSA